MNRLNSSASPSPETVPEFQRRFRSCVSGPDGPAAICTPLDGVMTRPTHLIHATRDARIQLSWERVQFVESNRWQAGPGGRLSAAPDTLVYGGAHRA